MEVLILRIVSKSAQFYEKELSEEKEAPISVLYDGVKVKLEEFTHLSSSKAFTNGMNNVRIPLQYEDYEEVRTEAMSKRSNFLLTLP